ncbi:RNF4 ligase, partial [Vidua chalybeata]|nr:RNF4 ligase [Vidua chalybeata]
RKRPGGAIDSRPARKRSRLLPSSAGGTSQTEPRDLEESATPAFEPEFLDLTGDSSELGVIAISIDESPVVQDREQSQQYPLGSREAENSAELRASDSEEEPRYNDEYVADEVSLQSAISDIKYTQLHVLSGSVFFSAQQGLVIRCPICMDSYSEILQSGRLIMATMCGHVFCSECLPAALETVGVCPTCRAELTPELYHPIYL